MNIKIICNEKNIEEIERDVEEVSSIISVKPEFTSDEYREEYDTESKLASAIHSSESDSIIFFPNYFKEEQRTKIAIMIHEMIHLKLVPDFEKWDKQIGSGDVASTGYQKWKSQDINRWGKKDLEFLEDIDNIVDKFIEIVGEYFVHKYFREHYPEYFLEEMKYRSEIKLEDRKYDDVPKSLQEYYWFYELVLMKYHMLLTDDFEIKKRFEEAYNFFRSKVDKELLVWEEQLTKLDDNTLVNPFNSNIVKFSNYIIKKELGLEFVKGRNNIFFAPPEQTV